MTKTIVTLLVFLLFASLYAWHLASTARSLNIQDISNQMKTVQEKSLRYLQDMQGDKKPNAHPQPCDELPRQEPEVSRPEPVVVPTAVQTPLVVMDAIPTNGTTRCFVEDARTSRVRFTSIIGHDCLVEMWKCDGVTNLAYDVFVHAGKSITLPVTPGVYAIDYHIGGLWLGYSRLFANDRIFNYPRRYTFTDKKGAALKIASE